MTTSILQLLVARVVIGLIAFPELKTVVPSSFYSIPPSALEVHLHEIYSLTQQKGLKTRFFLRWTYMGI